MIPENFVNSRHEYGVLLLLLLLLLRDHLKNSCSRTGKFNSLSYGKCLVRLRFLQETSLKHFHEK